MSAKVTNSTTQSENLRKNVDILMGLLLLASPQDQSGDDPSNTIQIPDAAPYTDPSKPQIIGDVLHDPHRVDGATKYRRNVDIVADETHGKVEDNAPLAKFSTINKVDEIEYFIPQHLDTILETKWTSDTWPIQMRRVITNEACVDVANTINVVEPVVACLGIYLAPFLIKLNQTLQGVFTTVLEYSIQVRHECPTATGGRSDILITLEYSRGGKIPEMFYFLNENDNKDNNAGLVHWASAERFGTRLLTIYNNVKAWKEEAAPLAGNMTLDGRFKYEELQRKIEKATQSLPCLVLHIIEDKKPAVIDTAAFQNPHVQDPQVSAKAYENVTKILPQLKRYALEYSCPWITLSDYFNYLTFLINPDAVEVSMKVIARNTNKGIRREVEFQNKPALALGAIHLANRLLGLPRLQIFFAVIARLSTAGVIYGTDDNPFILIDFVTVTWESLLNANHPKDWDE
ncbi:hypothetical protein DL96DRAFT_1639711 [Flagelloscypha sp. PMI_526]|nr:hypothetical protein DL96DRAFT_1639711 [Flagelloscypha sp. PMI_526]